MLIKNFFFNISLFLQYFLKYCLKINANISSILSDVNILFSSKELFIKCMEWDFDYILSSTVILSNHHLN